MLSMPYQVSNTMLRETSTMKSVLPLQKLLSNYCQLALLSSLNAATYLLGLRAPRPLF